MKIIITRRRYSKYGVDGTLSIGGQRVCDTCEHPANHLVCGTYPVTIIHNKALRRKLPTLPGGSVIKTGDGPFKLLDGSIIVGDYHLRGVVIHSAFHFNRLIDRLDKAQNRGEPITLTIQDRFR